MIIGYLRQEEVASGERYYQSYEVKQRRRFETTGHVKHVSKYVHISILIIVVLLDDQYFIVLECLVPAGDDALTRLQAFEHFVVLRVLTAYTDVSAIGFAAAFVEHEYPLASCGLEEGATRDDDGLFWLRTIRKQHPETPIVLLTAYADVNLAVKGLKSGAADFITKPWDNDELVHKLKDVLDMKNEIVSLDEIEKDHIRRTIDHCHGNLTQAAELLGITRQTLYNKMKRLN